MSGSSRWDEPACRVHWSGQQAVAALPAQVHVPNVGRVRGQLLTAVSRGATVLIVDMTATISCDHVAIGALEWVLRRAAASGTELRLVVTEPAVRGVIALSGLDRRLAVFPTLEAAQATEDAVAGVIPLFPRADRTGPAPLTAPSRPHPVPGAVVGGPGHAARQRRPGPYFEEALTRVTGGILEAGHTLQSALDGPAGTLREAVGRVLDLLDGTVREGRAAAFAGHNRAAHGLAGDADDDAAAAMAGRPVLAARAGPRVAPGDAVGPRLPLAAAARETRAYSRRLRARTVKVARLSASTEDRVAANLGELADRSPHRSAHLQALSQAAASRAAWMRQWAQDHADMG